MRRVSYLFPHTCDLMFDVPRPFSQYLMAMVKLADRQDNFRTVDGPMKREISVLLAHHRLGFERLNKNSHPEIEVTEEADIQIILTDTILRSSASMPLNENRFLVKGVDKGNHTEVYVTKSPAIPGASVLELKEIILGLFR
ncbi:MAG TPA: hypothetical protein VJ857_02560 [Methanocorpusculum sp.]|nr:hypothetical protein [Methanocorpusculum sp.]HJJ50768.1 hypothetical protein [Methanocorpusculum sp.]HKL97529.1 hypothetical protein [Methanocorpusculum sp.]